MGNTSEELADIKKRTEKPWPVKDKDYHVVKYSVLQPIVGGWIKIFTTNRYTRAEIVKVLADPEVKVQEATSSVFTTWVLYPGKKPDKKWGKVCP